MKASARWHFTLLVLLIAIAGCSQRPVDVQDDAVTYLREAEPVSVQTAQTTAIRELLGDGLRPQGKVYTETFTAVDLYDAPFVHITITSPKKIGEVWQFAKKLKGNEWPKEKASAWGITVTGATEARTPVSQIEYGLGTFLNIHKTVKAMGGPGKFERIVAPLSGVFWLEDKKGNLWNIYTHEKVSDEAYEQAKEMYDSILEGIEIDESEGFMTSAWAATPALSTASISTDADGAFDLADFATLSTQANYEHRGVWYSPEFGKDTLIGEGGYAQEVEYYDRSGKWRVGSCAGFGIYSDSDAIGCGPAAFSAMLGYHFKYRGEKVNGFKLGDPARYRDIYIPFPSPGRSIPIKVGDGTYDSYKRFVSAPVGSEGVPRLIDYMGSCYFNREVATSGGAFSNGGKAFLQDHAPDLKMTYGWSRGFSNPGSVGSKVDVLNYAKRKNIPSVVLYPSGFATFHFSFVRAWKAERRDYGLFVRPENNMEFWVNMGDSFRGEVGVWSIY